MTIATQLGLAGLVVALLIVVVLPGDVLRRFLERPSGRR